MRDIHALAKALEMQGTPGRQYKAVAGVLRNTGGVWACIDDAGHRPLNIASVSQDATTITIVYTFNGSTVGALLCVPDEAYAKEGISFGASVGTGASVISAGVSKTVGGYISYGGAAFAYTGHGLTDASWVADHLLVTHEKLWVAPTKVFSVAATPRNGGYTCRIGSVGEQSVEVFFYDAAGAQVITPDVNMKFYFTKTGQGEVNPISALDIVGANIWVIGLIEV